MEKVEIKKKGLVLCFVGNGKGKTTAAIGTAVRAAGVGMNVCVVQFVKAREPGQGEEKQPGEWSVSGEIKYFRGVSPHGVGEIDSVQVGRGFVGILGDNKERGEHVKAAIDGLNQTRELMLSEKYGLLVLDEILTAVDLKLLEERDIIELIGQKPELVHLVLTGHKHYKKITEVSDTVTEMKVVKHAYYSGIQAQKGVDF